MRLYLRQLDDKVCWEWDGASGQYPWLVGDQFPAAPIRDLKPSAKSAISVWLILDDRSNLPRIAASLAAGRNTIDKFDYALLDEELLTQAGVKLQQSAGDSRDRQANKDWHWDLIELTLDQLFKLAQLIHDNAAIGRFFDDQVGAFIKQAIDAGRIRQESVNSKILAVLPS